MSVSLSDRGQTTQDFAVGIGIFLLTIAFVFAYLPSLATPYESSIGGAETAQADRIADRIVENTSDSATPNELNKDTYQDNFAQDPETLVSTLGLRASEDDDGDFDTAFDRIHVTIESLDEDETVPEAEWSGGHDYADQTAASSARIVTVDEDLGCNPACRLIVRVW